MAARVGLTQYKVDHVTPLQSLPVVRKTECTILNIAFLGLCALALTTSLATASPSPCPSSYQAYLEGLIHMLPSVTIHLKMGFSDPHTHIRHAC